VSYGEVLVDKGVMYIRVTVYCGHLIILCFNLDCGGFILFSNVCVCVFVGGGGYNVCVCVGFCNLWVFW
jgi:hypothetical protein